MFLIRFGFVSCFPTFVRWLAFLVFFLSRCSLSLYLLVLEFGRVSVWSGTRCHIRFEFLLRGRRGEREGKKKETATRRVEAFLFFVLSRSLARFYSKKNQNSNMRIYAFYCFLSSPCLLLQTLSKYSTPQQTPARLPSPPTPTPSPPPALPTTPH